ncbi:MAG: hypothetical protein LBL90_10710 [Prevotellaceae bacterium]|jgi:hypothetical protein|nr:hypothetical protein [Prevotellaceae bacterium]
MEVHEQILLEDKLFIELLQKGIQEKGFKAEANFDKLSVQVADKLDISSKIMAVKEYEKAILYHVLVIVSDDEIMPEGIEDNLAVFGNNPKDAVQQGVNSFIIMVFLHLRPFWPTISMTKILH